MNYDESAWKIDDVLSLLRGGEQAMLLGARQQAVESITAALELVDRDLAIIAEAKEGLIKAREVARVANVEQLEQCVSAVKVIVEALRGK